MAAQEADADTLADLPTRNACAKGVDLADHFMARNAGKAEAGKETLDGKAVRVTDAARLDTNPDLPRWGRRQLPLHEFQTARLAYLNGAAR